MSTRAYYSNTEPPAYTAYERADDVHLNAFLSGERIGPPGFVSRRRRRLRSAVVMLVSLGGGWVAFDNRDHWKEWSDQATNVIATLKQMTAAPAPAPGPPITAPEPAPLQASDVAAAPAVTAGEAVTPSATATTEAAANESSNETAPPDPLPPPKVDPADPYQKRAVAVGLHPDLSRALLERLTPTDYRNAGIAIKTALAETAEADVFTWPKQRKPELALFEVHFVRGAAGDCRRYVVTITKDGWLTTASPMEKCGIERPPGHTKRASAG